ncbi:MAG: reprolysin-like metallopeptidase [Pyrinomonadaceae bacterium]
MRSTKLDTSRTSSSRTHRPLGCRLSLLALGVALAGACVLWPTDLARTRAATRKPAQTASSRPATDHIWQEIAPAALTKLAQRQSLPRAYRALRLDRAGLTELLRQAPLEFSEAARKTETIIALPLPDSSFGRFRTVESPIMEPALAAHYPQIKTYRGQGLDDPTAAARFDWTPAGLHAIILSARGTFYIEPYTQGDDSTYLVYAHRDLPDETGALACMVTEAEQAQALKRTSASTQLPTPLINSGATLRTYRLAVAATAEYTQTYGGGTVDGALAAITTTINLVDAIYERDVGLRLVLVANETSIIFTDTATDGYTSDNVGTLINENPNRLNAIIGAGNYDIGHVFDGRLNGGGFSFQGLTDIGVVCATIKGRGATILRSVQPSNIIAYYIVAHEMGHQFGATHTFNANVGDCGFQRASATAYEPGTGSTIMGYRFNCGGEDLRSLDTYFHNASLEQIINYTTNGNGGSCAVPTATGNNPPSVSTVQSYTVPANTPFTLTAFGSDPDGDALTYTWEEFDLGPAAPPDTDDGARPIFRSFAPTTNPARTFPRLSDILTNVQTFGETLPTTTRTMNFRVTARDNHAGGGGINSAAAQVNVRADSGPFNVTAPASNVSWPGNSLQTITWNVANTASAPISCANVQIMFSTDGGNNFPYVISSTPNDGSEVVVVPNAPTNAARIKVAAVGNVFFDISDVNFTILDNPCSYTIAPTSQSFNANAGTGSVNVTTTSNCGWGAVSNADWLTVTAGAPGTGNGTVSFAVAANSTGLDRTGTINIAGQVFTVTQTANCTYTVSPNGPTAFPAGGGSSSLIMTTGAGCHWTASSFVPWLTITDGSGTGPGTITFTVAPNAGAARTGQIVHTDDSFFTISQAAADTVSLQFSSATYSAGEGSTRAQVNVTRSGDTTGPASVGYLTVDDAAAVRCDDTANNHGAAYARCDYATTIDTLTFAANETSKTFNIPLIDDAHVEGDETVQLRLLNPVGGVLGAQTTAMLTINDNDAAGAPNPVFNSPFFIRQHYLDFLSREPDAPGFNAYLNLLNGCADVNNLDPNSASAGCDRIAVSTAFFGSQEFQLKGFYVFRFYKVAFNRLPQYTEIVADMRSVTGSTAQEVFMKKAAFSNAFTQRTEFTNSYGALSSADYVTALLGRYNLTQITAPDPAAPDGTQKVTLTGAELTNRLNAQTLTRAQVLRAVADSDEVFQLEAKQAFVGMQYYGYLRRTPDTPGFNAWLNYLTTHPTDFRTMVNGFMNSQEYRLRFGPAQ